MEKIKSKLSCLCLIDECLIFCHSRCHNETVSAEHLHKIPIWEKQIFFVGATSGLKDKNSNINYSPQTTFIQ